MGSGSLRLTGEALGGMFRHGDWAFQAIDSMIDEPVTSFDILPYLRAGRRHMLLFGLIGLGGGLAFGFLAPKWYETSVSVVPTGSPKAGGGIAAAAMSAVDLPIDLGLGGGDVERVAAIFKSQSVTDAVIDKFGLMSRYDERYREDARETLQKHCSVKVDKKPGVVTVTCEDKVPQVARDMVAYYAEYGNDVARRVSVSSAAEERRFLEKRLLQAQVDLDKACQALRDFQQQNSVISLPEQAKAVVESIATLRAEMIAKQTQLAYVDRFAASEESTSSQLRAQVGILKSRLKAMEDRGGGESSRGSGGHGGASTAAGLFPPAMDIPPLQYQLGQILREQKVQETLVTLLTQRYEIARMSEARDTSSFQVMDRPMVPTKKSRPKRVTSAAVGMFGGALFGLVWAQIRRRRSTCGQATAAAAEA